MSGRASCIPNDGAGTFSLSPKHGPYKNTKNNDQSNGYGIGDHFLLRRSPSHGRENGAGTAGEARNLAHPPVSAHQCFAIGSQFVGNFQSYAFCFLHGSTSSFQCIVLTSQHVFVLLQSGTVRVIVVLVR